MKVKTLKIFMIMERLKELLIVFCLSVILIEFLLKWIKTLTTGLVRRMQTHCLKNDQ